VKLLRDRDDPLFPGVDQTEYNEYRARVLRATNAPADASHILQAAPIRDRDRTEFEAKLNQAKAGDADAMFRVGVMFERGIGTGVNHEQAFAFYKAAAEKGISFAKVNVALCYLKGRGVEPSNTECLRWLEDAVKDPRMPHAKYELGSLLLTARANPGQIARGIALLREVESIIPEAQYLLGCALEEGLDGGAPKYDDARRLYEQAAAAGIDGASVNLATMYLKGNGVPVNINEGIRILEQAAVKNAVMAMCNLGDLHTVDTYNKKDPERAKQWYRKAVDLRDAHAMLKLGVLLCREARAEATLDRQLELNRESAILMGQAAELGNLSAMINYGKFLIEGTGVPVNGREAVNYLTRAIQMGSDQARVLLGQALNEGKAGLPRAPDEAVRLWREASAHGFAAAQAELTRLGIK
jgi:TPR repeat protein